MNDEDDDGFNLLTEAQREAYLYWQTCYTAYSQVLIDIERKCTPREKLSIVPVLRDLQTSCMTSAVEMTAFASRDFHLNREKIRRLGDPPSGSDLES